MHKLARLENFVPFAPQMKEHVELTAFVEQWVAELAALEAAPSKAERRNRRRRLSLARARRREKVKNGRVEAPARVEHSFLFCVVAA